MDEKFELYLNDIDRFKPTDLESQDQTLKKLMGKCELLGETEANIMVSGFRADNSTVQVANDLITGFSIPAVITSTGFVLKQISPLIIEYLKTRPQKEISIEHKGQKISVKGGGSVGKELHELIRTIDEINQNQD